MDVDSGEGPPRFGRQLSVIPTNSSSGLEGDRSFLMLTKMVGSPALSRVWK